MCIMICWPQGQRGLIAHKLAQGLLCTARRLPFSCSSLLLRACPCMVLADLLDGQGTLPLGPKWPKTQSTTGSPFRPLEHWPVQPLHFPETRHTSAAQVQAEQSLTLRPMLTALLPGETLLPVAREPLGASVMKFLLPRTKSLNVNVLLFSTPHLSSLL